MNDFTRKKFKAYSKQLGMSEALTLRQLAIQQTDFGEFDEYFQYLGFTDANGRELYEGDVIELVITPDMLDIHKNPFAASNIGKYIIEQKNITSLICEFVADSTTLSTKYNLYCLRNGKILRHKDGALKEMYFHTEDSLFPQYLINKGAVYIGNIIENPELIQLRGSVWHLSGLTGMNRVYIETNSADEAIELANMFGEKNVSFKYPNWPAYSSAGLNNYLDIIKQAYQEGFVYYLFEKSNPESLWPVNFKHTDNKIPIVCFHDFKYSCYWKKLQQCKTGKKV